MPIDEESALLADYSIERPIQGWKGRFYYVAYYVPILDWLSRYKWQFLIFDFLAGISTAAVVLPHALAYAGVIGMDASAGLFSAFTPLLVYGFLGQCAQLSVGPEATVVLLLAGVLGGVNPGTPREEVAAIVTVIAGIILILLGLVRAGFIQSVLSRPLLSGYRTAVVIILFCDELDDVLGIPAPEMEDPGFGLGNLVFVIYHLKETNWYVVATVLTAGAFLVTVAILRWRFDKATAMKVFPDVFVMMVCGTLLGTFVDLANYGVKTQGEFRAGMPTGIVPPLTRVSPNFLFNYVQAAFVVALVGYVQSAATAKRFANLQHVPISANRELIAIGLCNFVGAFFHSFPTFGSLPKSIVNFESGVRTQLGGIVTAGMSALVMNLLTPYIAHLPRCILSIVILKMGWTLIAASFRDLRFLASIRSYIDLGLLVVSCGFSLWLGTQTGLLVSVGVSLLMVIHHSSFNKMIVMGRDPDHGTFHDISVFTQAQPLPGIMILRVGEPRLHFANVDIIRDSILRARRCGCLHSKMHPSQQALLAEPPLHAIIFDMSLVEKIDGGAMQTLRELIVDYQAKDISLCVVGITDSCKALFFSAGIIEIIGADMVFGSIAQAVTYLCSTDGLDRDASGQLVGYSSYANIILPADATPSRGGSRAGTPVPQTPRAVTSRAGTPSTALIRVVATRGDRAPSTTIPLEERQRSASGSSSSSLDGPPRGGEETEGYHSPVYCEPGDHGDTRRTAAMPGPLAAVVASASIQDLSDAAPSPSGDGATRFNETTTRRAEMDPGHMRRAGSGTVGVGASGVADGGVSPDRVLTVSGDAPERGAVPIVAAGDRLSEHSLRPGASDGSGAAPIDASSALGLVMPSSDEVAPGVMDRQAGVEPLAETPASEPAGTLPVDDVGVVIAGGAFAAEAREGAASSFVERLDASLPSEELREGREVRGDDTTVGALPTGMLDDSGGLGPEMISSAIAQRRSPSPLASPRPPSRQDSAGDIPVTTAAGLSGERSSSDLPATVSSPASDIRVVSPSLEQAHISARSSPVAFTGDVPASADSGYAIIADHLRSSEGRHAQAETPTSTDGDDESRVIAASSRAEQPLDAGAPPMSEETPGGPIPDA